MTFASAGQTPQSASRAAGYCGAKHPSRPAFCTKSPGHRGPHVDFYTGRKAVTDTQGHEWSR